MAQPLALVPLGPGAAAIAASLGRQSMDAGQIDAGDQVFVLSCSIVKVKLLVGLGGLPGQLPQGRKVKAGGGGDIADRLGNIRRVSGM